MFINVENHNSLFVLLLLYPQQVFLGDVKESPLLSICMYICLDSATLISP